jgi:DNA-binding NtrC family response regulator
MIESNQEGGKVMKNAERILVVDDDAVVGRSFDRVLTEKGYDVSTVLSGEEGLKKVGTDGFDLVFTDIKMPGMDGLEMAKRIKEMNPWMPVVVVTGYGSEANEARAGEVGVTEFLRKPLTPEIIEQVTRKTLQAKETATETETAVEAAVEAEAAVEEKESVAKNLALFFAAPFIGLAYIIAFPFVGLAAFLRWGLKAVSARHNPSETQG